MSDRIFFWTWGIGAVVSVLVGLTLIALNPDADEDAKAGMFFGGVFAGLLFPAAVFVLAALGLFVAYVRVVRKVFGPAPKPVPDPALVEAEREVDALISEASR